ncbi:hypothetical protein BGZ52_008895, partial [Haplosporangium bisporale]
IPATALPMGNNGSSSKSGCIVSESKIQLDCLVPEVTTDQLDPVNPKPSLGGVLPSYRLYHVGPKNDTTKSEYDSEDEETDGQQLPAKEKV